MNIYLIGFMGAGKTTVVKLLAEKLDMPFVDLDDVIKKKAGLAIPTIFEKYGEAYFRQIEADTLHRIAQSPGNVVATGGGIVLHAENRKIMKQSGVTVYLKWQAHVLYQRIKTSDNRPLLKGIEDYQLFDHIERILQQREPFYEQCDIIIDGDEGTSPVETAELIIQQLSLKQG